MRYLPSIRVFSRVVILLLPLLLASCLKAVESRGYTLEEVNVAQVQPQLSTKEDVLQLLGTPSSKSYFGKDTWFYISSKAEKIAFMNAKTIEQHVIGIEFNEIGKVTAVQHYALSDAHNVQFVKDVTPTEGSDTGAVGQILGNVGRFNPADGQATPRTTPRTELPY